MEELQVEIESEYSIEYAQTGRKMKPFFSSYSTKERSLTHSGPVYHFALRLQRVPPLGPSPFQGYLIGAFESDLKQAQVQIFSL